MSNSSVEGGYEAIEIEMLEADVFSSIFQQPPQQSFDIVRVTIAPNVLSMGGYGGHLAARAFQSFHRSYQDKILLWYEGCYTEGVPLWEVPGATEFTRALLFSCPRDMTRLLVDEEKFVEGENAVVFLPGFGLLHTLFAAFPHEIRQELDGDEVWDTDLARHILGWMVGLRVSPLDTLPRYKQAHDQLARQWKVQH